VTQDFYKEGVAQALRDTGFKVAEDLETDGTPYPEKSMTINAEALARQLRELSKEDEVPGHVGAENNVYTWDRPVTWQAPTNLSGLDTGQSTAGMMTPGNQRG
jgi:hypothetical protein